MSHRTAFCPSCACDCRRHLRWPDAAPVLIRFPYHERLGGTVNVSAGGMQVLIPTVPAGAGGLANVTVSTDEGLFDFDAALVFRADEGPVCRLGLAVEGADYRSREWLSRRHPSL